MLLFYLRHGDPIYDPDSLTPLGRRQAEALGKRLALYGVDEIYASSSARAMQTAKPLSEMTGKEISILDWCNESHAWRDLAGDDGLGVRRWYFQQDRYVERFVREDVRSLGREWHTHPDFADTAMGAGICRIQREADAWLESLGYRHDLGKNLYYSQCANEKRVALFAHQGFGLAFLSCVLDVPYPQFSVRFDMGHTGMTVLHFPEKEGWVAVQALQVASDAHLYKEGLPTFYHNLYRF